MPSFFKVFQKALRFLIQSQSNLQLKKSQIIIEDVMIKNGNNRTIRCRLFYGKNTKSFEGKTIIFIHGMSPLADLDPRAENACINMALLGFYVYLPHIKSIQELHIRKEQVSQIENICLQIIRHNQLQKRDKAAIFTVSFSGNLCLLAAVRPALARHISALFIIGAFTNLAKVIDHALVTGKGSQYARLILARNYSHLVNLKSRQLFDKLTELILEEWQYYRIQEPAEKVKKLSRSEREFILGVLEDPTAQKKFAIALQEQLTGLIQNLTLDEKMLPLTAEVFLVHGRHDNVIPAIQSQWIHQQLNSMGKKSSLEITPLLAHGDSAQVWKHPLKIIKFIMILSSYFKKI